MSKPTTEKSQEPLTAEEVVKALSYHGAFLKKHVLAALRMTTGVRIINEEQASDFGGKTRTSDILAFDDNTRLEQGDELRQNFRDGCAIGDLFSPIDHSTI